MGKHPKEQDCRYCRHYRRPRCLKHDDFTPRRSTCKEFRPDAGRKPKDEPQKKGA